MIGWQEVIMILAILLFVFGPTELPKIAKELGKAWYEFSKASSGVIQTLTSEQTTKEEEENKLLLEVAQKLDLTAEGKTGDELTKEILTKIINRNESSN